MDRPGLKYPPFTAGPAAARSTAADLFEVLKKQDVLLHHPFQSFLPVIDFIRTTARRPERHRHQADRVPHRHRLRADGDPDRRGAQGQGSHGGGGADGALRRGSQHQLGGAPGGGRRARGLRRGRPQDPRQDGARRAPRGRRATARCCAATCTSPPATTTRAPRGSYTDFGLLTAERGDLRRRRRGVQAAHRPRAGGQA